MDIKRVKFKSGFLENKSQAAKLKENSWEWKEIPKKLRDLIKGDRTWELSGSYGDPSVATPIQYQKVSFIGKKETEIIEFWNLGAVFFIEENTEEMRRIFRCLVRFDDIKK